MEGLISGEFKPLMKRKLTLETCRKFGYFVSEVRGRLVQVAPYFDNSGVMVAQNCAIRIKASPSWAMVQS